MNLNLGCGPTRVEGFTGIDIRPEFADMTWDLNDPLPFPDNVCDEIIAHDILEHFPQADVERILSDWIRVLKPGGVIHIRVPDLYRICSKLSHWIFGRETDAQLIELLYGGQDYPQNFHRAGFTLESLLGLMRKRGCSRVEYCGQTDHNINVKGVK